MKNRVTNTTDQNPLLTMLDMMSGPNAVERQEASGQRELVQSDVLPTDGLGSNRAAFEQMGIVIGNPVKGDAIFTHVSLPPGWSKRATDHSMWSDLVDDKGRARARVFYKAAFYDRSARITPERRFHIERDYDRKDYRTAVVFRVKDCGTYTFTTEPRSVAEDDWTAFDAAETAAVAECKAWLNGAGFPDFNNPAAYWG